MEMATMLETIGSFILGAKINTTRIRFDVQAHWAVKYLMGELKLPDKAKMEADWKRWFARLNALKDQTEAITYQGDFVKDLATESEYGYDLDVDDIFHSWKADKYKDILSYRDQSFASKFTGT